MGERRAGWGQGPKRRWRRIGTSGRNVTYRGGSTPTGEGRASECKPEQTDKTGQTSDRIFSPVQRVTNSFEFRSHPLPKSFALQLVVRSSSFLALFWRGTVHSMTTPSASLAGVGSRHPDEMRFLVMGRGVECQRNSAI